MGRKGVAKLSVLACAALLTACGGEATVDNTDPTATVTPLTRPSSGATGTATATQRSEAARPTQSVGRDMPGREISEAPASPYSEQEQAYLDGLKDKGVKVDGVEGPLIGAAIDVCGENGGGVVTNAIAGQLIEQNRTELTAADAAQLITEQAKKAYC
ncbi:putative secreted protein [Corynebacterium renale]|uniref:DUF732 domain-containing protein n=1 Tax=Corynebacterium renale TaxID=1724 RepID=A0A2A9DMA0_9CORY|nr:DUF732 domain-containing protein [Corynebacterium renale]PFG27828.1 hypothetical protein ATK06_0907 [Corynebacterium renale]SQG63452.1 putative secreted protein [Corynebacterium renale]SQI22049.1 putative secreted protein [Corynebacterium renale]STD00183.1 putative secreted protein [Corynebacterium renale]